MQPLHSILVPGLLGLLGTLSVAPALAQFTYPGCADLQPSDFVKTELVSREGAGGAAVRSAMREPVAFDVHGVKVGDSVAHADVYFVERLGSVVYYNGATKTVTQIGTIDNSQSGDNGLMGIVLDPDFSVNNWIYLWYSPPRVGQHNYRGVLARYTLNPVTKMIDMASGKELLNITLNKTTGPHSGGPMQFDAHGDLWGALGNNSTDHQNGSPYNHFSRTDSSASDEWGSSSTASLRGGIWRIRPDTNDPRGYTIPPGNFGEYWAEQFLNQGKVALALDYITPGKVLPEIYVKGERSNHSIAVHPTKRWVGWGTVNFDAQLDELNLVTHPAFTGYPYFHGNQVRTAGHTQVFGYLQDTLEPRNESPFNGGATILPPAQRPMRAWASNGVVPNVSIAGPIYVYDRNLKSDTKFPPHLHNRWLGFTENSTDAAAYIHAIDSVTVNITSSQQVNSGSGRLFSNVGALRNPLQGKYGPEGALYLMFYGGSNYSASPAANPAIVRIDYVGDCRLPPVNARADYRANPDGIAVLFRGGGMIVREAGDHVFTMHDASGRLLYRRRGERGAEYRFPILRERLGLHTGIYTVRVQTARGVFIRSVSLL